MKKPLFVMVFTIQYIHTNQQQELVEAEEHGRGRLSGIVMFYALEAKHCSLKALT